MSDLIKFARRVIEIEANSLLELAKDLNEEFLKAVNAIISCNGKLIITGMGKSGHIARKLAATFSSTGTPALFLHPAEAIHGDLGIVASNDVVIAISYGGESQELFGVIKYCNRKNIKLIAMTGKPNSTLGRYSSVCLSIQIKEEACPLGLAPTASSTATLALGDALAMTVLKQKGFTENEFAEFHPGGSLGFRLLTRVKDIMHTGNAIPLVEENSAFKELLSIMTNGDVRGAAGVVDNAGNLIGVVTDGDIRRFFEKSNDPFSVKVKDLMVPNPITISEDQLAEKALKIMEDKKVQMLIVLKEQSTNKPTKKIPVGIIGIQDLLRAKIK